MKKQEKLYSQDSTLVGAIRDAYQSGEEDESLEPIITVDASGEPLGRFKDGDYVIFYDIRGEREIQLTESLTDKDFDRFPIEKSLSLNFVTMIEYHSSLDVKVAFHSNGEVKNTLTEVITKAGFRLIKIAESEKAIHVGFFLNGKRDEAFPGEERVIIPSPQKITSYASAPEMSAREVTEEILSKASDPSYQVIIANLANVDVVGHVEDKEAILRAVETVDCELGKIIDTCSEHKITLVVTSDHGTVEEWLYEDGSINTGHTKNPVPFIIADFSVEDSKCHALREKGELSDVAPTVLELLGIDKPLEMTGKSLLTRFERKIRSQKRVLLLILDGWGIRERQKGNLIIEARTDRFDQMWAAFPHAKLGASGEAVGMPPNTVGNSEAGHLHLGAGRRIFLDRVKIDLAIDDGSFFQNQAFLWAMEGAKKEKKSLHLLGIVSHYSSHGTLRHLHQLLHLAKRLDVRDVYVHALIGRRGEKPESGAVYVRKVEEMCREFSVGQVVTVMGRFWALDREENWDRIEKAYKALVFGEGRKVPL